MRKPGGGKSELVDVEVFVAFKTRLALAAKNLKDATVFLPLSLIEFEEYRPGGIMAVTMPRWLAEERELI